MPPLSFQAPPPRRLAVRRHFKPKDQRPYRPIRGAARFLNSPLWSKVLRRTALPRIAYGGALTAALLLLRYVSLHLAGSLVGPAAFVRAGVQHRANEIDGFLMASREISGPWVRLSAGPTITDCSI